MIEVIQPKIGERIYDGACGSSGFLCESFEYLTKHRESLSTGDLDTLQRSTFYGKEKKNLAYIIGVMNMILHLNTQHCISALNKAIIFLRDDKKNESAHSSLGSYYLGLLQSLHNYIAENPIRVRMKNRQFFRKYHCLNASTIFLSIN